MTNYLIRNIVRSIIFEMDHTLKHSLLDKSVDRVPFNIDTIKNAIIQGRELGINFKSNNSKYTMPVTKSRIILPVALGYLKNGNLALRAWHVAGQSEKEAQKTGVRSAEVEGEWRLFNQKNFKGIWPTDRFFQDLPPGFNSKDKHMVSIIASFNPIVAKAEQSKLTGS